MKKHFITIQDGIFFRKPWVCPYFSFGALKVELRCDFAWCLLLWWGFSLLMKPQMDSCSEVPSQASHFHRHCNPLWTFPFLWGLERISVLAQTHSQCRYQSVSQQTEALSSHPCALLLSTGTNAVFGDWVKWRRIWPIPKSKTGNWKLYFPQCLLKSFGSFYKCCPPCFSLSFKKEIHH